MLRIPPLPISLIAGLALLGGSPVAAVGMGANTADTAIGTRQGQVADRAAISKTGETVGLHFSLRDSAPLARAGTRGGRGWAASSPARVPAGVLFVSPRGSDRNLCALAAPCASLARAYSVARPGGTVRVTSGTYSDTTLPFVNSKSSGAPVLFEASRGATPVFSHDLHVQAHDVELRHLVVVGSLWIGASARNVVIRDDVLKSFDVVSDGRRAPTNVSFIGDNVGPALDENNIIGSNGPGTSASPRNILLDRVRIHDFRLSPGSSAHVDCLQVWAADGLTIRDSRFSDCEVFDIFLQKLPGGSAATPRNILIENNFLDCCRSGYYSLYLANHSGANWTDVTVRNNSSDTAFNADPDVPYSNVRFDGNIAPQLAFYSFQSDAFRSAPAGINADYNVWYAGKRVGPHDQHAQPGYADPSRLNFHLVAGAAAIRHGDPNDYPAADIDGRRRPNPPDAGAAQHGR